MRGSRHAEEAEQQLRTLVAEAPRPTSLPRLLYSDATPEALAFSLGTGWQSGAVLSAEAGAVLGSHGMGQDTILRNLALLDEPMRTDAQGAITPACLALTPSAQAKWIDIHDCIEDELHVAGEYKDIRDVASKAADNIARLAALFHVLENGPSGSVDVQSVAAATTVITWHLGEARRLLGALEESPLLASAIRLDDWLRQDARRSGSSHIATRRIIQYGPRTLRDAGTFRSVMALLAERGRARLENDGIRRFVAINPALLDEPAAGGGRRLV